MEGLPGMPFTRILQEFCPGVVQPQALLLLEEEEGKCQRSGAEIRQPETNASALLGI